jgi:hypothetical protein
MTEVSRSFPQLSQRVRLIFKITLRKCVSGPFQLTFITLFQKSQVNKFMLSTPPLQAFATNDVQCWVEIAQTLQRWTTDCNAEFIVAIAKRFVSTSLRPYRPWGLKTIFIFGTGLSFSLGVMRPGCEYYHLRVVLRTKLVELYLHSLMSLRAVLSHLVKAAFASFYKYALKLRKKN